MKKLFALLLALAMVLCCGCGQQKQEPETEQTTEAEGYPGVDFTVYDREGNPVSLSDQVGKPVIVNFWATWCGPCKSELPAFQQAYETYGDQVVFMMVDMVQGRTETKAGAIEYVDGQGYSFPLYFDEDQTAVAAYEIGAVPATFVIDETGKLVTNHVGAMSYEQIETLIKAVL